VATPDRPPEGAVQVPVVWVGAEEMPVHFANAFLGVVQPNEIFLTIGSIVPPPIVGETPEEREQQARSLPFIQATPIARLGLTPARLDELVRTLQETQANYAKLAAGQQENQ